jgi:hypothetical protein
MFITLTHFEPIEDNKELEITVSYDTTYEVLDILSVVIVETSAFLLPSELQRTPITNVLKNVSELDVAINKIVARVDWRELYAETVNQ